VPPERDLRDRSFSDADFQCHERSPEEFKRWQNRPLEEPYPIVYLDALMVKVRDEGHFRNKAIYMMLRINLEVAGLWVAQTERAKF